MKYCGLLINIHIAYWIIILRLRIVDSWINDFFFLVHFETIGGQLQFRFRVEHNVSLWFCCPLLQIYDFSLCLNGLLPLVTIHDMPLFSMPSFALKLFSTCMHLWPAHCYRLMGGFLRMGVLRRSYSTGYEGHRTVILCFMSEAIPLFLSVVTDRNSVNRFRTAMSDFAPRFVLLPVFFITFDYICNTTEKLSNI